MPLLDILIKIFVIGGFFLIVTSKLTGKTIGELIEYVNNFFKREEEE